MNKFVVAMALIGSLAQAQHSSEGWNWMAEDHTDQFEKFDCDAALECEWVDCSATERYGDDQDCWKEVCTDTCGDYLCVIWHWGGKDWVQGECDPRESKQQSWEEMGMQA